jgi:hypothetical protein
VTYWKHAHHKDSRGRQLADRHYSRKTVGAAEYMPPGYKIVLIGEDDNAVWGVQRSNPKKVSRRDGFVCWDNTIFRIENDDKRIVSPLIREAVAICIGIWKDIPPDGLHTFIDIRHVNPMITRSMPAWGESYVHAGFSFHSVTKGGLIRFVLSAEKMKAITPIHIPLLQPPLFEMA